MATYLVSDPSGQKHKIQGPDGASPQEVIAQAQKIIPYKPTAGVGGMTQPPPQQPPAQPQQGGMPGQPPAQGGQQNPLQGMNLGSSGVNILGQLLLNRAGLSMPQPQQPISPAIQKLNQMYPQLGGALTPQNIGQLLPSVLKNKPPLEWSPVSGTLSDKGTVLEFDKTTGQVKDTGVKAKSTGFGSTMGPIRQHQYTMQDLPSNQGPSTAAGAAYQVLVASQQGMNLIAKPGSPQRTGLATGDLARAVLRNSPTDEAMKNANFSDTLIQRWSNIKQKVSADPSSVQNPQIRKEMYDIFSEMRQSAMPFVKNQLDDMDENGFPVPPSTRKRQLGETLPSIPFQEGFTNPLSSGTAQGGWSVVR